MRTLLLALVACAPLAFAESPPVLPGGQPLLLRLEGRLATASERTRVEGRDVAKLTFLDGEGGARFLSIEDARTIGADQSILGKDVLNDLKPSDPNLLLTGPKDLLDKVRAAPSGTKVVLEGLVDRGQHTYLLRDVRIG